MITLNVSLISCKSILVRVIGSNDSLRPLFFFRDLTCSHGHGRFIWVDIICGSMPPCFVSVSSSSEGDFCLLRYYLPIF